MKSEELKIIFEELRCEKRFDEPMRRYTSFRIGGNADLLIFPDGAEDLKRILYLCRKNRISLFVIGFGT
ncbi:MAG: UDP-N-acetylenolpyruvoylglucosamine reductase, partial [Nitrospinae bacterium]|nr:UDP-N-acetylenolpyruvoylglucosamine reductase [Nitrospinota bacterium]